MAGTSHVDDISEQSVAGMISSGFIATSDPTVLKKAKSIVICVPTPLADDGAPDMSAVVSAAESVAENVVSGTLISLESTTSPGTTEEVLVPLLEKQGFKIGIDVFVVFSPERIDPGNTTFTLRNTPKVVGGITPECTRVGVRLYEKIVDVVVPVSGTKEAELTKLLENTYRHVNIALVNELARYCHELDIDIWEVIRGAATKPFGFQAFYPGPGVGGHCIPIDPNYLSYTVNAKLGYPFRMIELAQEVNNSMPQYVATRAQEILNLHKKPLNGSTVLVLGITYKANISDRRQSPATDLVKRLLPTGADVHFNDPFHDEWTPREVAKSIPFLSLREVTPETVDLVIVLQHHDEYDLDALAATGCPIIDTRGVMTPSSTVTKL